MREATLTLALPLDIFRHLLDLVAEPVDHLALLRLVDHPVRGALHRRRHVTQGLADADADALVVAIASEDGTVVVVVVAPTVALTVAFLPALLGLLQFVGHVFQGFSGPILDGRGQVGKLLANRGVARVAAPAVVVVVVVGRARRHGSPLLLFRAAGVRPRQLLRKSDTVTRGGTHGTPYGIWSSCL